MKMKIVTLLAFALFAAGSVYAAEIVGGTSTTIGGGSYTPSTKVHISVVSLPASYGATSQHESGTTLYGSGGGTGFAKDVGKIFTQACATNPCGTSAPPAPTATDLSSGTWN
ncbi:MAG: hypothetical protein PHD54_09095 [Desulfuromonadaceae bacterium]|nr:hypothetical protein [Desulfuromonadaceae bacterium]